MLSSIMFPDTAGSRFSQRALIKTSVHNLLSTRPQTDGISDQLSNMAEELVTPYGISFVITVAKKNALQQLFSK